MRLALAGGGTSAEVKATTWSETFSIARTIEVDDLAGKRSPGQSGTAQGYVLYTHRPAPHGYARWPTSWINAWR